MLTTMKKYGVTLAIFSALATALTASVYFLTKSSIDGQLALQQRKLFEQIIPAELYDNEIQSECYLVTDSALGNNQPHRLYVGRKQGATSVVAIESTAPDGYSGAIQLLIGADLDGNVYGVRVTEHHETPGLGDKIDIRISDWIARFSGKTVNGENDTRWAVRKDGGQFDQFTGATITPRAVIKSVKQTVLYLKRQDIAMLPRCGENR